MREKRWNILPYDSRAADILHESLNINKNLCKILAQRGIDSFEKAKDYFRPQLNMLHDPYLMKDMDKAVERILSAFAANEKILVFGDYDVDGTTSVACMYSFLKKIYKTENLEFYIPHRYREGYGISKEGIDFAHENNYSLIISLDCGIKSAELIAYAKSLGIDFIICDHHLPDEILPEAVAILNPKRKDCEYPYKELCGCGVGFKLMTALASACNINPDIVYSYLDLVATAIGADIVPIDGENRVMAYYGLQKINTDPNPGIKALKKLAAVQGPMTISSVVFIIAPRVNAAGRMDDARKAVQLFLCENEEDAIHFAEMLHSDNSERKEADRLITEHALEMLDNETLSKKTTVVYNENWHKGVVGIVASRLIESYYRPTVVLTKNGDYLSGSARSIPGFNLYDAIYECRDYLIAYGGHFAAAGLSLLPENLTAFTKKFDEVVSAMIDENLLTPEIIINTEISFSEIKPSLYNIICQMEPFGPANMRPVFITKGVKDTGYSKIVKENHIKFVVAKDDSIITGIGFNLWHKFDLLKNNSSFDIVFTIDENEWNGNKSLQLKVIDLKPSAA